MSEPRRSGLTGVELVLLHAANVAVAGSGVGCFVFRYLLVEQSEFGPGVHAWQPLAQHLHVWSSPLLVFAIGLMWRQHLVAAWRGGWGRRATGVLLATVFFAMAASGYAVQTAVTWAWRLAWVIVHCVTGTLWLGAFVAHQFARRRDDAT